MVHRARRTQQGQSSLEYMLVLAAIIAAVAIAAGTVLTTGVKKTLDNSGTAVQTASETLAAKLK